MYLGYVYVEVSCVDDFIQCYLFTVRCFAQWKVLLLSIHKQLIQCQIYVSNELWLVETIKRITKLINLLAKDIDLKLNIATELNQTQQWIVLWTVNPAFQTEWNNYI